MAKKMFVNKTKMQKALLSSVVDSGITTVSFLGSKGITNKLVEKGTIPEKFQKIIGPIKFVVGTLAHGLLEPTNSNSKFLKPIALGLAISGGEDSAMTFIPEDTRDKIGLSGPLGTGDDDFDINAELDRIAKEAEAEAEAAQKGTQGLNDDNTEDDDTEDDDTYSNDDDDDDDPDDYENEQ